MSENHGDNFGNSASTKSITIARTGAATQTIPPIEGHSSSQISKNSHLDIPSLRRPSRFSLDSTFSELSELSYVSSDPNRNKGISRIQSNTSNISNQSNTTATKSTFRQKFHAFYVQNYGAFLVLLSQGFGSAMNVSTRFLEQPGPHGEPMHPFQILFARQFLTALLCTVYALVTKSIPHFPLGPKEVRGLLISRGLCGFFGVFGLYFSLLYLPLSEATVLTFLGPILTCYVCSWVIPGQTFSRQQQLAGLVSLVGVVFIAKPFSLLSASAATEVTPSASGDADSTATSSQTEATVPTPEEHLLAIGLAMIGVLGATGAMTSIRAIGTRAHAFVSINYFSVWSTIVCLVALIVFPSVEFRLPGNLIEWGLLFSLGIFGFGLQTLLTMGLAYGGPASKSSPTSDEAGLEGHEYDESNRTGGDDVEMQNVNAGPSNAARQGKRSKQTPKTPTVGKGSGTRATSMVYTQMLFALFADRVVFGTVPGLWSWIGSGLILAGAIWVAAAREPDKSKPTTSSQHVNSDFGSGVEVLGEPSTKPRAGDRTTNNEPGAAEEEVGLLAVQEDHADGLYDDTGMVRKIT